ALEFIWGNGGVFLEPEAAVPATAYMRTLIADGISPAVVATADEENARLLFGDGRAVFKRNWPYAWRFLQQAGSPVRGRIGVAPLPSFPGHEPASVMGGWMLAVPERARHAELASALAVYLASEPVQQRMASLMSYSPSRRALYEASADDAAPMPALLPVFEKARPRPLTPYYLTVSHVLQPAFSEIVVGRKSANEALNDARRHIAAVVGGEQ
ncbi:MAG TPA: extracellular solute-binding protein, partial [Nitrospirales bacterium]|nr:extracellular solute-binding protein [Nitrospirales bacterium]